MKNIRKSKITVNADLQIDIDGKKLTNIIINYKSPELVKYLKPLSGKKLLGILVNFNKVDSILDDLDTLEDDLEDSKVVEEIELFETSFDDFANEFNDDWLKD